MTNESSVSRSKNKPAKHYPDLPLSPHGSPGPARIYGHDGLSTLNRMAFGLAAGTVRSMVGFAMWTTPTPRKTRFQLLVRLYWTGFPPVWFRCPIIATSRRG